MLDLLAGEAERRAIRLERELPAEAGSTRVAGEEERLRQVLVNLTLNALEATPDGGQVRVRCAAEAPDPALGERGTSVTVAIDDSGPGVPAAMRDRHLRALLHHQGQGLGPGPLHRPRHRVAARRDRLGGAGLGRRGPLPAAAAALG